MVAPIRIVRVRTRVAGGDRWTPLQVAGAERHTGADHARLALEELGATFIKLGQILSTRADLLPADYVTELSKLQDSDLPVAVEEIRSVIREEFGGDPETVFASFENAPLASASIGQVHRVTLIDGTKAVVKVRRPGVVEQVDIDLRIVEELAAYANRHWKAAADYDIAGLTAEFTNTLRAELDYIREAHNAERFAENFRGVTGVRIPVVHWEWTTSQVLTLDEIVGVKVNDVAALDAAGIDRPETARLGADIILKMIFEDGFFHADPHAGNLIVEPNGTIGVIDFGMVGEVDDDLRQQLGLLLLALINHDPEAVASAVLGLSASGSVADPVDFRADLARLIPLFADRALHDIRMGPLLLGTLTVIREHHLHLPAQTAMLLKVVIMTEGLGVALDPNFVLTESVRPFAERLIAEQFSLRNLAGRLTDASADAAHVLLEAPGKLRAFLDTFDPTAGFQVHLRAGELEPLVGRAERVGNRVVAGIIIAALINGIGSIAASDRSWRSWERPLMGAGMGALGALGGYLAWSARRRGRG
ncbi:AarF/UbiB family protein [soil metagenome]